VQLAIWNSGTIVISVHVYVIHVGEKLHTGAV